MELRQLQYFIIVSQEQSFSKAAKKAYISQQAISKAISSLEEELGVLLFVRNPQGVELTSYGQMLLKKAYNISNSMNEITYDMHIAKDNLHNIIPLAISEGTAQWLDMKKLLAFRDNNPQYRVSTILGNDKMIENDIISEKLELGLMGSRGTTSKLEFISLNVANTFVAINKKNPLSEKNSLKLIDLKHENFIIGSDDFYGCNQLKTLCNTLGFSPVVLHETHNIMITIALLSYNEGVFLCPEKTIKYFDNSEIRLIPLQDDPKLFSAQLAFKKNIHLSKSAELLKNYILKNFAS